METKQATPVFDFTATFNAALAQAIQLHTATLNARIAALEEQINNIGDTKEERIKEIADEAARDVLSEHVDEYDHDSYDRLEDKLDDKIGDAIDEYDFEDKIKDVLTNNLTLTVRVD